MTKYEKLKEVADKVTAKLNDQIRKSHTHTCPHCKKEFIDESGKELLKDN